jgi:hypothetical protein
MRNQKEIQTCRKKFFETDPRWQNHDILLLYLFERCCQWVRAAAHGKPVSGLPSLPLRLSWPGPCGI